MTSFEKYDALLKAFDVPSGADETADAVRGVLCRLMAARAVRLAHLQTARDIVARAKVEESAAYLFLAAMFVSSSAGNAFMRDGAVEALLISGGYLEESEKLGFADSNEGYASKLKCLCASLGDAAWKTSLDGDVLRRDGGRWFFLRDQKAVEELNTTLKSFATARKMDDVEDAELAKASTFVGHNGASWSLNEAQRAALKAAVTQQFTVVTGGPGTGKTTTVCAILRALLSRNPTWTEKDIALAAPTGRAAQRMQEAILAQCQGLAGERIVEIAGKLKGSTVHRLLGGYAPNWKHDEKHKLEQRVIIVDETSMVDLYLMQALLKALDDEARLILLGDADQLPSVDTGAVLGDLTKIGIGDEIVRRLEVCERAKGEVLDVSTAINGIAEDEESAAALTASWQDKKVREMPDPTVAIEDGKSEFRWYEPKADMKKADVLTLYSRWMSGSRLVQLAEAMPRTDESLQTEGSMSEASRHLFDELNRFRVLTLVREGWYGVKEANAHLLKVAKSAAKKPYADYLSLVGVPIMVTKNTVERKLFNGDVGVTVKGPNGMVVLFPRGEKTIACPVALLPEHELAYAMTVHKSQGSEFENVMVVLPNDKDHPLLTRQIVYTGITRAKKRAVIVGTEEALKVALSRKLERDTGISLA